MILVQTVIFAIVGLALVLVVLGFLKNIRGPHKGKYRFSWFQKK